MEIQSQVTSQKFSVDVLQGVGKTCGNYPLHFQLYTFHLKGFAFFASQVLSSSPASWASLIFFSVTWASLFAYSCMTVDCRATNSCGSEAPLVAASCFSPPSI